MYRHFFILLGLNLCSGCVVAERAGAPHQFPPETGERVRRALLRSAALAYSLILSLSLSLFHSLFTSDVDLQLYRGVCQYFDRSENFVYMFNFSWCLSFHALRLSKANFSNVFSRFFLI